MLQILFLSFLCFPSPFHLSLDFLVKRSLLSFTIISSCKISLQLSMCLSLTIHLLYYIPAQIQNLITVCISYFRYNVLRRMLPLANLFMAHFVLKKTPSRKICVAVFIIVAGCVLAGNSPFLWWAQNERKKLCVEQLLCPWNCITCIYASRRRNS